MYRIQHKNLISVCRTIKFLKTAQSQKQSDAAFINVVFIDVISTDVVFTVFVLAGVVLPILCLRILEGDAHTERKNVGNQYEGFVWLHDQYLNGY